jgi:hypothetical protein
MWSRSAAATGDASIVIVSTAIMKLIYFWVWCLGDTVMRGMYTASQPKPTPISICNQKIFFHEEHMNVLNLIWVQFGILIITNIISELSENCSIPLVGERWFLHRLLQERFVLIAGLTILYTIQCFLVILLNHSVAYRSECMCYVPASRNCHLVLSIRIFVAVPADLHLRVANSVQTWQQCLFSEHSNNTICLSLVMIELIVFLFLTAL